MDRDKTLYSKQDIIHLNLYRRSDVNLNKLFKYMIQGTTDQNQRLIPSSQENFDEIVNLQLLKS